MSTSSLINQPNVLAVGNGFDVMHKIPTSYVNFIDGYAGKSHHFKFFKSIRSDLDCIDVEKQIEFLHLEVRIFLVKCLIPTEFGGFNFEINSDSVNNYFKKIYGFEINEFINSLFLNTGVDVFKCLGLTSNNLSDFEKEIMSDFDMLVNELSMYLSKIEREEKYNSYPKLEMFLSCVSYIVNYNYTSVAERFYGVRKKNERIVIHPHGKVGSSIVLGIPHDKADGFFKKISKEIQVISKNLIVNHSQWNNIVTKKQCNNGEIVSDQAKLVIALVGHSLGETDWYTLKKITYLLDESYVDSSEIEIFIFYHNYDSKLDLISNLFEMIGKDFAQEYVENGQIRFLHYDTILN
ncbi:hypothetical protein G7059_03810 [Erysipelothrix sp. HDW6A]|uniref:AbiH family protein n=1 Tax=Erysipelothrix sp. HDW6A TaxID=2714928 RepID=UPI00140AFABE|nr:AbiH family protein [Erysipelothrix sp. HDW6A]QIK57034.1 hypothetical protein G7059_03810 [Erysipelothrix sp. HDW6A]